MDKFHRYFLFCGDFMDYYLLGMLVIILIILAILHKLGKNKKPLLRAFGSMIIGLSALFLVNVTSVLTQVHIPISMFTVGRWWSSGSSTFAFPKFVMITFLGLLVCRLINLSVLTILKL